MELEDKNKRPKLILKKGNISLAHSLIIIPINKKLFNF